MSERSSKPISSVFIVGIILTTFSSIFIGVFNIGIVFLLGMPVLPLIVGPIFVWVSSTSIKYKAIVSLLPIPLILISFFIWYQIQKAAPESFLVRSKFRGNEVVFLDEQCGQAPATESGRRIYEIPESGVLITRFTQNDGLLDQKIYFVSDEGIRTEIPSFHRQRFDDERNEWKLFHREPVEDFTRETVGGFWGGSSEVYALSKKSIELTMSDFRSTERDEKERWLEGKRFAELAGNLLKECRANQ